MAAPYLHNKCSLCASVPCSGWYGLVALTRQRFNKGLPLSFGLLQSCIQPYHQVDQQLSPQPLWMVIPVLKDATCKYGPGGVQSQLVDPNFERRQADTALHSFFYAINLRYSNCLLADLVIYSSRLDNQTCCFASQMSIR